MGFFGLGTKEKIDQGGDARAREERVRAIPVAEQGKLCEIALGDADSDVRVAAAARIREPEYLESLSRHKDPAVARIARDRLTANLVDDLKKLDHPQGATRLAQVAEQSSLAEIALRADKPAMREAAFARLCSLPEVTQSTLAIAAIQEPTGAYGRKILERIDARQLLKDLSKKAKDAGLRAAAAAKLAALDAEAKKPSPEQRRRALAKDLKALQERAQVLAISERWDEAAVELADVASRSKDLLGRVFEYFLTQFADHGLGKADGKVFRLALGQLDQRVLRAGGRGYVMKQEGGKKLLAAIRRILAGEIHVSEKMASKLLAAFSGRRSPSAASPIERLTDRELEVFQLIGQGLATRQIASQLHLSHKTIEVHRMNIKQKLGVTSAPELIRYAVRWVESQPAAK